MAGGITYVVFSYRCNLSCSYCFVKDKQIELDQSKFFKSLKELDGDLCFFGGEPSLDLAMMERCYATNPNFKSVSTNLLCLTDQHISFYKRAMLDVSTSWNPERFTESQLSTWKKSIQKIKAAGLSLTVMVTLTDQVIEMSPFFFSKLAESWQADAVLLQPIVPMSEELHQRADQWLCQLKKVWPSSLKSLLQSRYQSRFLSACGREVKTLQPNGEIHKLCSMAREKIYPVLDQCLQCQLRSICKPCPLQSSCSVFKKFFKECTSKLH